MENQERQEGDPHPPPQPIDVEAVAQGVLATLMPQLSQILTRPVSVQQALVPPKLSSKASDKQVQVMYKVLNCLLPIKHHDDPNVASAVQEVFSILERRTADLEFADTNPNGFKLLDQAETMQKLLPGSDHSAILAFSAMMPQLGQQSSSRKRPYEERPFRERDGARRQASSRASNDDYVSTLVRENQRLHQEAARRPATISQPRVRSDQCSKCFRFGHWRAQCDRK